MNLIAHDGRRPRVAVMFHRFGPYHAARLRAAANELRVLAVELSSTTSEYPWLEVTLEEGVERATICDDADSRSLKFPDLYVRLDRVLAHWGPDAVAINGWSDNGALATLYWCHENCVPAVVMSESNEWDFQRTFLKEMLKRAVVGGFSAGFVGGQSAAAYLEILGMASERIFDGYDVIDNSHFERPPGMTAKSIRQELRLPRPYFLSACRFIPKKNIAGLVDAYAAYRRALSSRPDDVAWDLVVIGDGELRGEIESKVVSLGLAEFTHLPGFVQYASLPKFYWGADAFVHASITEQWGLVINESMAAGVPVIVSGQCGAVADLIDHGKNGYLFDPMDTELLSRLMVNLSIDEGLRADFSRHAQARISAWNPERFGKGLLHASQAAITSPRTPSWVSRQVVRALCR